MNVLKKKDKWLFFSFTGWLFFNTPIGFSDSKDKGVLGNGADFFACQSSQKLHSLKIIDFAEAHYYSDYKNITARPVDYFFPKNPPENGPSTSWFLNQIQKRLFLIDAELQSDFLNFAHSSPLETDLPVPEKTIFYTWISMDQIPEPEYINAYWPDEFKVVLRGYKRAYCDRIGHAVKYLRVVTRQINPDDHSQYQFLYSEDYLKELKKSPLQLSMLLVHEWLRNFTKPDAGLNTDKNLRRLNICLHTRAVHNMERKELRKFWKRSLHLGETEKVSCQLW